MDIFKPIYDEPCERAVIGTLLTFNQEWHENADLLSEELFYTPDCKTIYRAAQSVSNRGVSVDIMTVMQELLKDANIANNAQSWMIKLTELSGQYFHDGARQHLLILQDKLRRRQLAMLATKMLQTSHNESVPTEQIQTEGMDSLGQLFQSAASDIKSIYDVIKVATKDIIDANRSGCRTPGIPTGFKALDEKGGLQLSDLVIIAADSSQGKTSFMLGLMRHASSLGYPVAIYSMEMTAIQLLFRMVAMATNIPSNVLNTKPLDNSQYEEYILASDKLAAMSIYFDEKSTNTLDGIIASIRTVVFRYGVKLVAVDYLQILNLNIAGMNKEQATATAARRLKNLAKELNICIIALSQLARDRDNPEPSMARLRDSGQIAEAADMVILIYRPEVYGKTYSGDFSSYPVQNTALIHLAKGRNTGTAKFIAKFDAPRTMFSDANITITNNQTRPVAPMVAADKPPF